MLFSEHELKKALVSFYQILGEDMLLYILVSPISRALVLGYQDWDLNKVVIHSFIQRHLHVFEMHYDSLMISSLHKFRVQSEYSKCKIKHLI